ncbi:hypothetical protein [Polaromonas sp. CG9_12]|nr:hypothetical protein [Polaromonas sp. CG9_12]
MPDVFGLGTSIRAEIALGAALVQSKARGVANARIGWRMAQKYHAGASAQLRAQRIGLRLRQPGSRQQCAGKLPSMHAGASF